MTNQLSLGPIRIATMSNQLCNNLLLSSNAFSSSYWVITGQTLASNGVIAPDGTTTAITSTLTSAQAYIYQTLTLAVGTYTYSMWIQAVGSSAGKQAILWGWNGTAVTSPTWAGETNNITLTLGWQRLITTFTVTTAGTINLRLDAPVQTSIPAPAIGDTVNIWGAQLDTGIYATTNINTTTSAVSFVQPVRNATYTLPAPERNTGINLEWEEQSFNAKLITGGESNRRLGFLPILTLSWSVYDDKNALYGNSIGGLAGQQLDYNSLLSILDTTPGYLWVSPSMSGPGFIVNTAKINRTGIVAGNFATGVSITFKGGTIYPTKTLQAY